MGIWRVCCGDGGVSLKSWPRNPYCSVFVVRFELVVLLICVFPVDDHKSALGAR